MTQFCGKTLYHLQHASVDQPISNFRKKHHKYVRKKKHQWNKKLNTFNLAITDTETSTNQIVEIMHKLHLTMVDQKVFNALTDTKSSMCCYVCSAKPKQFNNLSNFPHPQEWHLQVWHFTTPQVELLFWDAHTHVIQNRSTKVAKFISRRSSQSFCQEENTYTMDNHPCVVTFAVQHPNNSTICPTSHTPRTTLTSMAFHHSTNGFIVLRCSQTFHTE